MATKIVYQAGGGLLGSVPCREITGGAASDSALLGGAYSSLLRGSMMGTAIGAVW